MGLDFTIAIPTYNGGDRLPAVLARLRSQTGVAALRWEILIVDNNSTDHTAAVVREWQAAASLPVPLRYAFVAEQGAAYARLQAIALAQGHWVGFLDDDNWPDPDWLSVAHQFCQQQPHLGAFGGRIRIETTVPLPPEFNRIAIYLAIRDHGDRPCPFDPPNLLLPAAAALFVRREAWLNSVPDRPRLGGKRPGRYVQGDDYEPLLYLHQAGWPIWYCPDLKTAHQVPPWRLERDYLIRLAHACGLSICSLRMILAKPAQRPWITLRLMAGGLKRSLQHLLTHRCQAYRDIVLRTELEFHWASVLSPWIYWWP